MAGLRVEVAYAESDADDSITLWFPDLGVAVHNLVWPTLFNIFAIRGEMYRDPQILIRGLDHLRRLRASYLVGTHGPPLIGNDNINDLTTRYRDSIAYLWDQTVRGINRGWTADELADRVRLPELYDDQYLTSERYGVAEHHVRQIHSGLRGWFDGDVGKLFPLAPHERSARYIEAMGGYAAVRSRAEQALKDGELRWALELASLVCAAPDADAEDRRRLADALRVVAKRTPAANIRSWCLTRARHLDGTLPLDGMMRHNFNDAQLAVTALESVLGLLRVNLDPERGTDEHITLLVNVDNESAIVQRRNGVLVVEACDKPDLSVSMTRNTLHDLYCGRMTLAAALASGAVSTDTPDRVATFFGVLDLPAFRE
jgi:alkyl sulfatase BDS1-like metallo-beta-lactamase superfamily hydrolase